MGPRLGGLLWRMVNCRQEIDTLVFADVPGWIAGDATRADAIQQVRAAEWATVVPADGSVGGAAVELFEAGATQTVEPGGVVG